MTPPRAPGPLFSDTQATLLWAGLVGMLGALATVAFREGLAGLQWLLVGRSGSMVEMAKSLSWPMRVALPCLGGVVAGSLLLLAGRHAGDSKADYMESIALGDGVISVRQTLLRSLSSLCSIGSGGSIGREAAMIQLAATSASVLGSARRMEPARLRLLVACGAAAGITAAYNAPIASAFFISEIVLGSIAMQSLGPIMIAAVTASITMRALPGYKPTYEMPAFAQVANQEVALFIGLGIVAGLAAPQFLRLLELAKQLFQRTRLPLPLRLGLGGLLVGVISVQVPQVWGNGYSVVNSLLHTPWLWTSVVAMLCCKVLATALTTGSGAVGGIFTPTLFVGAALGHLFGQGMHALWPAFVSGPEAYTIVGMGAFLAAASSAPMMAIVMIFEMTASYQVMLPLMLACVIAYFVANANSGKFMYDIMNKRRRSEEERWRVEQTRVSDLIRPAETVLPLSASLRDMTDMFARHPVKYIYIVDEAQRYQGVVALQDLSAQMMDEVAIRQKHASDFVRPGFLDALTPALPLAEALQHFLVHQGERLPVVQDQDNPVLLGAVHKTSLLDAYVRLQQLGH